MWPQQCHLNAESVGGASSPSRIWEGLCFSEAAAAAAVVRYSKTVATISVRLYSADLDVRDIAIMDLFIVKSAAVLTHPQKGRMPGVLLPDRKGFREISGNNLKCEASEEIVNSLLQADSR